MPRLSWSLPAANVDTAKAKLVIEKVIATLLFYEWNTKKFE